MSTSGMDPASEVPARFLGQSGFRLAFPGATVYIDPYLTDRVAELEGDHLRRAVPVPVSPNEVSDADWVLVTHVHLDHCDLATLVPLAEASPRARFVGPSGVLTALRAAGVAAERLVPGREEWRSLTPALKVRAVPAAHPVLERDADGAPRFLGYVLDWRGRRIYHSGDTSLDPEMIAAVEALRPIDTALLPVNERNFYRERQGIIGNLTLREAFRFAEDLGVRVMVPMHWDMFKPNGVFPEEIELLHRLARPRFDLRLRPESL